LSGKYLDPDYPVPEARLNKFPGFYERYRTPECVECTARYAKIAADVSRLGNVPVPPLTRRQNKSCCVVVDFTCVSRPIRVLSRREVLRLHHPPSATTTHLAASVSRQRERSKKTRAFLFPTALSPPTPP